MDRSIPITLTPTQVRRPWRTVVRTVFQGIVGFAPLAPVIYQAATNQNPQLATGAVAVGLSISGGIARVMALPGVNNFINKHAKWLAADVPVTEEN
jgi:hypothetical protein